MNGAPACPKSSAQMQFANVSTSWALRITNTALARDWSRAGFGQHLLGASDQSSAQGLSSVRG
eukprot:1175254-Alexandrium_andersonii.AAC.1